MLIEFSAFSIRLHFAQDFQLMQSSLYCVHNETQVVANRAYALGGCDLKKKNEIFFFKLEKYKNMEKLKKKTIIYNKIEKKQKIVTYVEI